jgi:ABC-2 type transport system permease protein
MTAVAEPTPRLDVSGTARIPLTRLVKVELRKLYDTRAGMWLLIAIGAITAAIVVIFFLNAKTSDRTFINFVQITGSPQGFLLPVLGILLVTSEWSQRTALLTFTLMPVRGRVLWAKVIAAVIMGLAAMALALALAGLATVVGGSDHAWRNIGADTIGKIAIAQVSGILEGLAFGLILLNSAAAIVLYFVLPLAFSIITTLIKAMANAQPWIDLNTAQQPLFVAGDMSGKDWNHLLVATVIWVLLPFVGGVVRVLRAEVK